MSRYYIIRSRKIAVEVQGVVEGNSARLGRYHSAPDGSVHGCTRTLNPEPWTLNPGPCPPGICILPRIDPRGAPAQLCPCPKRRTMGPAARQTSN